MNSINRCIFSICLAGLLSACGGASAPQYDGRADPDQPPPDERYDLDPYEYLQWWFDQARVFPAQDRATGRGVIVAVLNAGIWTEHPEFQRSDGTAKFVRCTTILRPATQTDELVFPPPDQEPCTTRYCGQRDGRPTTDEYPHGTATASVIAAERNRYGMSGVAPDATLMSVAVMQNFAANLRDIADGIRWAADHGAQVIHVSLAGPPGYEPLADAGALDHQGLAAAVDYALARDIAVIAGAGAERSPLCSTGAYRAGVLCVLPTSQEELPAMQANLGLKPDLAAISAPGGAFARNFEDGLASADQRSREAVCRDMLFGAGHPDGRVPPADSSGCVAPGANVEHVAYSGSYAAPAVVSGVAAQLRELGCGGQQSVDILLRTARLPAPHPSYEPPPTQHPPAAGNQSPADYLPPFWSPAYGYGIVDADAATQMAVNECHCARSHRGTSSPRKAEPCDLS